MRFETFRWLLIPVMAIHNLEEWVTYPAYGSMSPVLAGYRPAWFVEPSWRTLEIAWVLVTVLPAVLVIAAAGAHSKRVLDTLVCWVACIYLANAIIPHTLDLAVGRAYSPGLASALLVNLPFCSLLLRQAEREHHVTPRQLVILVVLGFISLVPVLVAVFAVAGAISHA